MKLSAKQRGKWRAYIIELRKQLPCCHPVKVVTRKTPSAYAAYVEYPTRKTPYWRIVIGDHLNYRGRIDALCHEWAHCRDGEHNRDEHGPSWGVCYAEVYRVLVEVSDRLTAKKRRR